MGYLCMEKLEVMKIKVRVWNGEQMVSPDYIDRDVVAHWKENSIPCSSKDTMLFTGLNDRRGREIYEGDLVRYSVGAPWDSEVPLSVISEVTFDDPFYGCFCVRSMGDMDATGCLYEYAGGVEVIGNVHANPELLKDE